jgi:hypothetical protein
MHDTILEMLSVWYRYPLEQLEKQVPCQQSVVTYDILVHDPCQTVYALYERLGYTMSSAYQKVLDKEAAAARSYKSNHTYSLEQSGISRDQIRQDYCDILNRFGFE